MRAGCGDKLHVRFGRVGALEQSRPGLLPHVVRVTAHRGGREGRPQGEGAQVVGPKLPCGTRNAESQSGAEGHLLLPGDKLDCWRAK